MKRRVFKDKFYTHLDAKKHHDEYERSVKSINWVSRHGFYPFIHYTIRFQKYQEKDSGEKYKNEKEREVYYAAHIDRMIYQYYGSLLNRKYNEFACNNRINRVAIAYRDCFRGKTNIDFAKEVFEFIVAAEKAFFFIGDFSGFFDNLDHNYLKERLREVYGGSLNAAEYAIFKSLTRFSYIERKDIEREKGLNKKELRSLNKYFDTKEFHNVKKKYLKHHDGKIGIPQGSSMSAIYANVYMVDFDRRVNDFVTSHGGMYRRYSDDIVIVVPMKPDDTQTDTCEKISEFISESKEKIPGLKLNEDKTGRYIYFAGAVNQIEGNGHKIDYLGFSFDGITVRIREKSLFKYYSRAYRKTRKVKSNKDEKAFNAGKKAVYQLYTHLGAVPGKKKGNGNNKYGNFLTYAYKADDLFANSDLVESKIRGQVRRHWSKINNKLKEY